MLLTAATVGWIGEGNSAAAAAAELVSAAPGSAAPLSSDDFSPSVSGDGNFVVFNGDAFVGGVFSETVYVRNRGAGTTVAVPKTTTSGTITNTIGGVISRDGCHVAFLGFIPPFFVPGRWDLYSWNRCVAGSLPVMIATLALTGTFPSFAASISADGRYVAYIATPASAVSPTIARVDTSTLVQSVLVANPRFVSATTIDISDDGVFVAIGGNRGTAAVPNYQIVGWTAPCTGACTTEVISVGSTGKPATGFSDQPSVSGDGRYVAFKSDTPDIIGFPPGSDQVYVRDRAAGVTKLVTDTPGQPMMPTGLGLGDPDISPDGSQIALTQTDGGENSNVWVARSSSGFFDAAVFDLVSFGVSGSPVSGGSGASGPSMSATGRFVAFTSGANDELSGGTVPLGSTEIWLRERPIALDITPTLNFGDVDVGSQSAPQNAVVTNTSDVVINIGGVTSPAAPFSITANGCAGVLAAGATCAVTVVFSPTVVGGAASSITISGDGLSVSVSLVGNGRSLATAGSLKIAPAVANYGSAPLGGSLPAKNFTVTNPGQTAVVLAGVSLNGTGADQFAIVSNGCTGSLASGASCTISVSATVTRTGSLSATLDVVGTGGQAAHATLRIGGEFTPSLKMNPGVVSAGEVTAAIGAGFPPNIDVQLAFEGESPFTTVHTDGAGAFRFNFLILRNGIRIGGRQIIALDQPQFSGVRAPLLIDLATFRPSGFSSPAITSGVRSLVSRGG